jgi:hypothetical protein
VAKILKGAKAGDLPVALRALVSAAARRRGD